MSYSQRILVTFTAILIVFAVIAAMILWISSPMRAINTFADALRSADGDAARSMIAQNIDPTTKADIEFFIEDWISTGNAEVTIDKTESWREKVVESEESLPTVVPTNKYLSHFTKAYMLVSFPEYEDPVVITFERNTEDKWSLWSQLFKRSSVAGISYLGDGDFIAPSEDEANANAPEQTIEEIDADLLEEGEIEDETTHADGVAQPGSSEDLEDENVEVFEAGLIEQ